MPSQGLPRDKLVLTLDVELLRALEHVEWGRPLALGTVVREAIAKKEIIPIADYMAAQNSIYHRSWSVTPWGILSWGLQQLGVVGGQPGEDKLPVGKLVILSNVESAATGFVARTAGYTSRTDRTYSKKLFYHEFADVLGNNNILSQTDMDILLRFLSREKHLMTIDGETIKIRGASESEPSSITTEDATIASLRTLIKDLEAQVHLLTARVDKLSASARDAVTRKNLVAAKATLRLKKLAETNLSRQSATLSQLEEVYSKIGQASDQVELIRIMEGSTGVLKSLNAEIGGVQRVDDVVDQLKEQMIQVDEVANAMAEVGQGTAAFDESEVDDELQAMEIEDKGEREAIEQREIEEAERTEAQATKRRLEPLDDIEKEASTRRQQYARKASDILEEPVEESTLGVARMALNEEGGSEPSI
jgi:charged multivesicular body protein 7